MIDKREILETASTLGLQPSVVEKDYVLGWILAGIHAHPELSGGWVFKGGTCLKKCYFETYRFSEDLDFTLREEAALDESSLREALGEVAQWVSRESGLTLPAEQIRLDIHKNPRGRISCEGKIGYRGPVSPTSPSGGWPKIKLDLTADEKLVLPAVRREVFHPYSDKPEGGLWISAYAYEEAFGEKLRALGERTRPRDLYDVVNLYRHGDSRPPATVLRHVLQQKCAYKSIDLPTVEALLPHRADLESMWNSMLGHQLPMLPPVEVFWDALPEIFTWLMTDVQPPQLAAIAPALSDRAIRSRVLPMGIPVRSRSALEIIRFAAANHLCVDLTYDGTIRRIEPYSLRQTIEGNFVLHASKADSGEHRSYRIDRVKAAAVTAQAFHPRYLVELTPEGPLAVAPAAARSRKEHVGSSGGPIRRSSLRAVGSTGPTYVFRCSVCGKSFERKSMDSSLNRHKHPQGQECPGRTGLYTRTRP